MSCFEVLAFVLVEPVPRWAWLLVGPLVGPLAFELPAFVQLAFELKV